MVATISLKDSNMQESVSTCRFAQRVALVSNDIKRNEVLDDKTVIRRLREKVASLKVGMASNDTSDADLVHEKGEGS